MKNSKKPGRGALSDTKSGIKPVIACELERQAKDNIVRKLGLLVNAIQRTQASGKSLSPEYPSSRTQFNAWTPSAAEGATLRTNGNDTLKRYAELVKSVDDATKVAKALKSNVQPLASSRATRLASAQRAQRIHWVLRTIAERAAVSARRELVEARNQVSSLEAARNSAAEEFRRVLGQLKEENERLRAENATVVRGLGKIVSLRRER